VLPHALAAAIGSYMFYAQHNYPDVTLRSRHEWNYTDAALHAASYMKMGPVMEYFSGNIGYHHVHHLNSSIPFYNLPAAMKAIPELQEPGETSLSPREILACLKLKLWDGDTQRMSGY
jgi:omega-6 fatty acid desaturase (delta-12 desaturase)